MHVESYRTEHQQLTEIEMTGAVGASTRTRISTTEKITEGEYPMTADDFLNVNMTEMTKTKGDSDPGLRRSRRTGWAKNYGDINKGKADNRQKTHQRHVNKQRDKNDRN